MKKFLCGTASTFLAVTLGSASVAQAQEVLEEIVVTAQKREENSQKTAIAISTIQGEELIDRGISQLDNALTTIPGVAIQRQGGAGAQIFIRGIGTNNVDKSYSAQPSVALNIDGVSSSNARNVTSSMFDVERVEVLKGPQGTLYGASAVGGAVNVVLAQPGAEFAAKVQAQVTSYNGRSLNGMLNLPLTDSLAARLTVGYDKQDTWLDTPALGPVASDGVRYPTDNPGGYDNQSARLKLKYSPSDVFSLTGSYQHERNKSTAIRFVSLTDFTTGNPFYAPPFTSQQGPTTNYDYAYDRNSEVKNSTFGLDLELTLGNFAQLTFLPTWKVSERVYEDASPSEVTAAGQVQSPKERQDSYELRLASLPDSSFKWTVGSFVQKSSYAASSDTIVVGETNVNTVTGQPLTAQRVQSRPYDPWSVFGQVTAPITDAFRVTVGGRYSRDEKEMNARNYQRFINTDTNTNVAGAPTALSPEYSASLKKSTFTYKAGVELDVAPDSMLYAQVATGYKAGGLVNLGIPQSLNDYVMPARYKDEKSTSYQLGSKNRFLDNSLQVNAEAYYTVYDRMQVQYFNTADTNGDGVLDNVLLIGNVGCLNDATTGNVSTCNGAASKMYGLDVDTIWAVSANGRLSANLAYMKGKYGTFDIVVFGAPRSATDHTMAQMPELSGTLSYSHEFRIGNELTITPRVDEKLTSSYFNTFEHWLGGSETDAYNQTDLSVAFAYRNFAANAFARNIEDNAIAQFAHPRGLYVAQGRTLGANVSVSF
ncbi:MAG: TonB-dependent receptor [Steroidobacteraceae bacterium]